MVSRHGRSRIASAFPALGRGLLVAREPPHAPRHPTNSDTATSRLIAVDRSQASQGRTRQTAACRELSGRLSTDFYELIDDAREMYAGLRIFRIVADEATAQTTTARTTSDSARPRATVRRRHSAWHPLRSPHANG